MRVLYYAKHGPRDNQDELAIAHAFRVLGHEVTCVQEHDRHPAPESIVERQVGHDFCLFHKASAPEGVTIPLVSWYFDLLEYDEREDAEASGNPEYVRLARTWYDRGRQRREWAADTESKCVVSFYTDGDWVAKDPAGGSGKRVHLCQGMDERMAGPGRTDSVPGIAPILFIGMRSHGVRRLRQVRALSERYGDRFLTFGHDPRHRKHGRDLADLFASTRVVVAPVGPSTDRYWSNRVYLTTGLGGFLLHPWCQELTKQYVSHEHWMYRSEDHLHLLIDEYLRSDASREALRTLQYHETTTKHLYRHRVADLVRVVKERI